jgi:hypothetical protein
LVNRSLLEVNEVLPSKRNAVITSLFDCDRKDEVARTYIINHIQPLNHLTKAGMNTIKVLSISAIMADEEL